ncbi:MAG: LamG domain-containing protein [Burkholderiales bacterium]|nr:LamG domain-containing protein [Burkholderiales bacterium]
MQTGDLVVLIANARESAQALAISNDGGQSWTSETANTVNTTQRIFWARFNGTWAANPSVSFPAGANATTLVMHVFRPTSSFNTWALDVALTNNSFAAPGGARDVTIAGITTATNGALVLATWATTDDNSWGLQTAGWANAGDSQYRNLDGNDSSQSAAYRIMPTAGASGNVVNRQTANGGDAGNSSILAFREVPPVSVVSINCSVSCAATSAATVSWTVIFSQSVTGVDATAFTLAASGLSGAFISSVMGSGTTWTVTANTGIGAGTLGLNQTGPGSVSPTLTGTFTGQVYTITATPALAEYRMDEPGWSGVANEVADSSGSYPGTAMNSANTTDGSRAIPGNPGTCRYGVFDNGGTITQGYVALPGFPNLNTDFTITAWIRSTDITVGAQRILIDDETNTGGYGLSLGEGGTGVLRFYARGTSVIILDTPNVIANNTWYFVAGVADISNGRRWIYVFDASGNLLPGLPVSVASTGWGTDAGMASIGGETNASGEPPATNHFKGNLDEVRVYQKVLNQSALAALATQTHACAVIVPSPGGFNAYETGTAVGAITGVIQTRTAGSAISVDMIALNPAKTAILTGFADTVRVEVLDSSNNSGALDANSCRPTWTTIQTLSPDPTFVAGDNGRKTISFSVPNAYRDARLRITYPAGAPTVTGCSTDNFAIRPASFTVAATDSNWSAAGTTRALANTGATGGNVHKAGQPFTLTVTPSPGTATNYDGSPTVSALACTLPAVCANGTLSVGAYVGSGTRTSTSATYDEAGAFNLTLVDQNYASVDAADGTPADCSASGRYVCQSPAPVAVGRFVPDHFAVTAVTQPVYRTFDATDAACTASPRSFTYIGQSFGYQTLPVAMVTAQNASNGTTTNYRGTLWKLASASVSQTMANSPVISLDISQVGASVLSETANTGTGTLTSNAADKIAFVRDAATPQAVFTANLTQTWSVADANENSANQGVISTTTPLAFNGGGSGIAFDGGGASSGKEFRYGLLAIRNANGSQLVALPIWLFTQYWNGTSFIVNTADNCTALAGTNIEMSNFQGTLGPIASCKTRLPAAITFNSGRARALLAAPGAGVLGSVDLAVHLEPIVSGTPQTCTGGTPSNVTAANKAYLQGKWSGATYNQNPASRATFGVYRGSEEIIHIRENF